MRPLLQKLFKAGVFKVLDAVVDSLGTVSRRVFFWGVLQPHHITFNFPWLQPASDDDNPELGEILTALMHEDHVEGIIGQAVALGTGSHRCWNLCGMSRMLTSCVAGAHQVSPPPPLNPASPWCRKRRVDSRAARVADQRCGGRYCRLYPVRLNVRCLLMLATPLPFSNPHPVFGQPHQHPTLQSWRAPVSGWNAIV